MSLRPIDLQLLLKQTSSVSKRELQNKVKRRDEKIAKDQKIELKRENIIVEVDKTQVDKNVVGSLKLSDEKKKSKSNNKKEEDKTTDEKDKRDEKYKGNFLDIKEY